MPYSDSFALMLQPWTCCHAAWFWQPCLNILALDCLPCCLILTALSPCNSPGLSAMLPGSNTLASTFQPWTVCHAAWFQHPCLHVSALDCLPCCLVPTPLPPRFSPGLSGMLYDSDSLTSIYSLGLSAMLPDSDSLASMFQPWTVWHAVWFWQPYLHLQPWTVCHTAWFWQPCFHVSALTVCPAAAWFWQPCLHVWALDCPLCCIILTALLPCFSPGLSAMLHNSDSLAPMFQPWTVRHAAWFWQPCLHVSVLDCPPCCLILTALPPCFSPGLSAMLPDSDSLASMFESWTVRHAAWFWQPCLHVSVLDCPPWCLILTALPPCFGPGLSAMLPDSDSLASVFQP